MIEIRIDEDDLYEILIARLKTWTDDEDTIELFEQYYDHMVYGGCYDGADISIAKIVDNDYVNNTSIVTREEFEKERNDYIDSVVEEELQNRDEDDETTEEEIRESVEDDTPTWEDLEVGEHNLDFLSHYYIEAKTDNALLLT